MNTITEKDYKALFELNPFPLIVYDTGTFNVLDVNSAAVSLYGYTRDEFLSLKLNNLFFEHSINEIDGPGGPGETAKVYHRKKDGTRIPINLKSAGFNYEGRQVKLVSIIPVEPETGEDYLRLLFSSVVDSSDDAVISKDLEGKILSWNKGAEKMYGYKAEEVIGRDVNIIAPPDKKDEIDRIMDDVLKGKKIEHFETRRQTKDGNILWVSINVTPLKNSKGRIIGASAVARNITTGIEARSRLEENEVIFKHLIENLNEVFYVSDPRKPAIIYMSNAYEKVFGEPVDNIYKNPRGYLNFIKKEDRWKARRALAHQLRGVSTEHIYRIRRVGGDLRYLRERAFPIKNEKGEVFRIIGVAEDITERIESENEIRKSEYRYRSIFESTAVGMYESDYTGVMKILEGLKDEGVENVSEYLDNNPEFVKQCAEAVRMVDANPRIMKMFEAKSKEHLLDNFKTLRAVDFEEKFKDILELLAKGGRHYESEFIFHTFSGSPLNIYLIISFPEENSLYRYSVASLIDISERKQAERALSESELRFKVMADTAPVLIWTSAGDKSFYYFNKPWLDFRGRSPEEEKGTGWMEGVHPIDLPVFKHVYDAAFVNREEFRLEFRMRRNDGEDRWLLTHGVPRFSEDGSLLGFIGSSVDITERKRNEVDLSKALANEKRAVIQAEKVQDKLKYMAEASIILNSSLDYTETIQSLAKLLTPAICDWFATDLYEKGKLERLVVYHKDPDKIQPAINLQKNYTPDMNTAFGLAKVLQTGRPELYEELDDEYLKKKLGSDELYTIIKELGIVSMMIVPLKVRNKVLGAITLLSAESGRNYKKEDLEFAENIAHRAAIAIDNAYLFRQIEELNRNLEYTVKLQQKEIQNRKKIEKELRESEERFRLITENSNDFLSLLDSKGRFIYANPAITRVLGYQASELEKKISLYDLIHPDDRELLEKQNQGGITELRYLRKDGDYVWVESSSLKVNYHGQEVTIRISRNITERKRIENERVKLYSQLENQRIRIDNLIANIPGVVWEAYGRPDSGEQQTEFISNYVEELLGYPVEEWLSTPNFWLKVVHPDDRESAGREARSIFEGKRPGTNRFRWVKKDGSVVWVESHSNCILDSDGDAIGLRGVILDITEQVKFEQQLSSSLKEKEILLKEIHHRVKNNMQVISSLLSLQAKTIPDKKTQEIFDESRNRIRSMALIHEKLYQSKDLFKIDLKSYVEDLLKNLMISYGSSAKNIKAVVNIGSITFDIDSAITLGLIINELASNSYKHGFRNKREGRIEVSVDKKDASFTLIVKDDGTGIPEEINIKKTESLGLQLVDTLIEQLYGTLEMKNNGGTEVRIEFPDPAAEK